jgi:hypothetical protein
MGSQGEKLPDREEAMAPLEETVDSFLRGDGEGRVLGGGRGRMSGERGREALQELDQ